MTNYNYYYWCMLEPMRYYDKNRNELSPSLVEKYDNMISNKDYKYIATQKFDGEWTMFIKWDNKVLIRSRSISKKTGTYGDKTLHLPHLVEEMREWPNNSVVLAEVCWDSYGSVSTDVGTILRCLPYKAIERQKEKKLSAKVFDVLAWDNNILMDKGYSDRVTYVKNIKGTYFSPTNFCPDNMAPAEFADHIISLGGEGCVIQRKDCVYEPGKRSAWKTLKLKQKLPEMEVQVIASIPPTKEYNGKNPENWPYCIDNILVTKPYYLHWQTGIRFMYKGVVCDASSGLTDEDKEWLSTDEAQEAIKNGELFAVIRAMMEASNGGLRHPVVVRLRTDI